MKYALAALAVLAVMAIAVTGTALLADPGGSGDRGSPAERAGGADRGGARSFRGGTPPPGQELPRFRLRDHRGEALGPADLAGKAVVVTFLDTQCIDACPIIASQIGQGLRLLTRAETGDVVAVAITSDPEGDTPRSVRTFLANHRAANLRYLIGSERELRPVWDAFHVLPSVDTGDDDVHSAPVRIFDRTGAWVASLHPGADLTPENLAHDIRAALGIRS